MQRAMKEEFCTSEKTAGVLWVMMLVVECDELEGRGVWCWEKRVSVQLHGWDESHWMYHSQSEPGNVQEYLQKNDKIIMSFNVAAKYWNGLKHFEKLILTDLLKQAQNKS